MLNTYTNSEDGALLIGWEETGNFVVLPVKLDTLQEKTVFWDNTRTA